MFILKCFKNIIMPMKILIKYNNNNNNNNNMNIYVKSMHFFYQI